MVNLLFFLQDLRAATRGNTRVTIEASDDAPEHLTIELETEVCGEFFGIARRLSIVDLEHTGSATLVDRLAGELNGVIAADLAQNS